MSIEIGTALATFTLKARSKSCVRFVFNFVCENIKRLLFPRSTIWENKGVVAVPHKE